MHKNIHKKSLQFTLHENIQQMNVLKKLLIFVITPLSLFIIVFAFNNMSIMKYSLVLIPIFFIIIIVFKIFKIKKINYKIQQKINQLER